VNLGVYSSSSNVLGIVLISSCDVHPSNAALLSKAERIC